MLLDSFGMPRSVGRLFGLLLLADPVEQHAEQLAQRLQVSRSSISGSVRMLERMGLLERRHHPGDRRDFFRIRPNAWAKMMHARAQGNSAMRQLAARGLGLLEAQGVDDPQRRRPLEDMHTFFCFWERSFQQVLEQWEQENNANSPEHP